MKLDFLTWFICAFACYRVTILISRDLGPFNLCARIRDKVHFLKCPYCMSVYMGSLTATALYFAGVEEPIVMWFILSLSWSGSTIALDRVFTSDYSPK